ncbi:hypothetical protein EYF80_006687 [Liparis tanakae]|uniref:Uncharacterized protein n=1 Tax=Liparis tanakae TaxID=230148 RepID=A0A4Z2IYM1_9TELE|nr:hypothetical protein EYF80_006687 [Liparis tanakae]
MRKSGYCSNIRFLVHIVVHLTSRPGELGRVTYSEVLPLPPLHIRIEGKTMAAYFICLSGKENEGMAQNESSEDKETVAALMKKKHRHRLNSTCGINTTRRSVKVMMQGMNEDKLWRQSPLEEVNPPTTLKTNTSVYRRRSPRLAGVGCRSDDFTQSSPLTQHDAFHVSCSPVWTLKRGQDTERRGVEEVVVVMGG